MNILLIDDHPVVTVSLAARLRELGHLVDASHTLEDASRRIAAQHFELCVLGLDMHGVSGTRLLLEPALQEKLPDCIVVLSGTRDRDEIVGALEDGAHAFLSKTAPFDDVIEGILSAPEAYRGGEPGVWVQEVRAYVPLPVVYPRGSALSKREREVFRLMRRGFSDKAIADALDRSIHTIRVQIRSILRKRGSARRREKN
ncbi:MAG TPA: response regulator transcription factor [Magnetospirillaceae bacterium]|jgi:two-component system nitrate/nitrite response regulator NarL